MNLLDRRSDLLVAQIDILRDAVRRVRTRAPFRIDLAARRCRPPRSVARNQNRIREVLASRRVAITDHDQPRRTGIWQRRYWEHTIRDDRDFAAHMDHMRFNPVKHGLVEHAADWPHSS